MAASHKVSQSDMGKGYDVLPCVENFSNEEQRYESQHSKVINIYNLINNSYYSRINFHSATTKTTLIHHFCIDHPITVDHHHPFGCPCYVLDPVLQGTVAKLPQWDQWSHVSIYIGHLPNHAGSVALVLNLATGHVPSQFHVFFYDNFLTVEHVCAGLEPSNWSKLFSSSHKIATDED